MLFDQFLKLFYSQIIIFWDQHDYDKIKSLLVYNWRDDIIFIRLFQYENLFNRFTSDKKILFFLMNCYLNFLDEDLLWSSFINLLIDATATAETKVLLIIS